MNPEVTEELSRQKSARFLLYVGMVSIVMLFAGLTSAYIIRLAKGDWLIFELPTQFYISTIIIALSSGTLFLAYYSAKKDSLQTVIPAVAGTLLLGIAFVVSQFYGWKSMVEQGIFFTGPGSSVSASFLYVLTALHAAHASGGIISLLVVFINSLKKKYNSKKILGLQLCSVYWHFLGALWVYLFLFLLLVR